MNHTEHFDRYARTYESTLAGALGVSGEKRDYFARGRVEWLRRRLHDAGEKPQRLLDFGCGDGSTTPILMETFEAGTALGTDISQESIRVASELYARPQVNFVPLNEFQPDESMDLVYCSGVFHHIPPADRPTALATVKAALRPGGWFAYWENNPWNPATRYVMAQCEFDSDAITLTPPESRSLLKNSGFEIVRTDFRFIFPRALRGLRWIENLVVAFPLGTQYLILCRKPA
jgi:SAM-dependent methyltransferase